MELRTSLPEIFDEFGEARRQGFLTVKEIKEQGKPVVGVYCTFHAGRISACRRSDSDQSVFDFG